MPAIPGRWYQPRPVDPKRGYTALLGYVRLKSFVMFPRFAWYGVEIERQLKQTDGLVGFRLRGQFFAMTFFHLSAWESEAAIRSFVHTQPHRRIMEKLAGKLGDTAFRYWSLPGSELPLAFERELHRLQ